MTPLLILSVTWSPADCKILTALGRVFSNMLSLLMARIRSPTLRAPVLNAQSKICTEWLHNHQNTPGITTSIHMTTVLWCYRCKLTCGLHPLPWWQRWQWAALAASHSLHAYTSQKIAWAFKHMPISHMTNDYTEKEASITNSCQYTVTEQLLTLPLRLMPRLDPSLLSTTEKMIGEALWECGGFDTVTENIHLWHMTY